MFILLLSGLHTPIEHNFSLIYEVGKSNPLLWIQTFKVRSTYQILKKEINGLFQNLSIQGY